jgi:multiple sugar transport system substrate-binding protein
MSLNPRGKMSFNNWYARIGRLALICAIVCLLLALFSSGCGQATPTPEPATIVFAYPTFDEAYYEALAQKFNGNHSHIVVELRPREGRSNELNFDDVDVFVAGDSALNWLQEQGIILNLDPFIEQDEAFDVPDFYPGMIEHLVSGGKTWAIPAGMDMLVIFYNQDLFDRYDVPYPQPGWTWSDFLNIVLAMRDPETKVFGYALNNDLSDPVFFIYQHGGRIADDIQRPTRTTFDDPLTIEALEWVAKLIHEYDAVPTPEQARRDFGGSGYYIGRGFSRGQLGMWAGPFSQGGGRYYWPSEWDMRWGMVPLPRDAQSATIASVEGYFVSSQTRHPDACWQWIAFLSQQTTDRLAPARRSLVESAAYEQQVGHDITTVVRESLEGQLLLFPTTLPEGAGETWEIFREAIDEIINGRSTPRQAMKWAQQQSTFK